MLGFIILLAIAYACAKAIDNGTQAVSAKHRKRIAKAAKKKGRSTGAKAAAWAATALTAAGTFAKAFARGFKREWPKAKERATARFQPDKTPEPAENPPGPAAAKEPQPAAATAPPVKPPTLVLVKDDSSTSNTNITIQPTTPGGTVMALATIPEITGVNTLKAAVARFASEATVTAEEAGAIAQRAAEQLAAIEAAIEQASALEFGDDGGTLQELAALRDQYAAALAAAQAMQKAAVDNAAIAAQSSQNIHTRHAGIQEAVAAQGGRMASKQAYTNDV